MAIPMNAAEITYDFVAARGALDADVTITASGTSAGTNGMGTALVYPNELGDLFKGNFGFFFRGECTVKLTSEGLVMTGSKDTYISILNLKEGDKVTVYYTGSVLFCDNPVTNIEGITSQWTACESGTTYTLTADGNFNVQWKKSKTVITKITVETTATETVSAPGIAVTGVSGINRIVTITPGLGSLGSAVNTYYTINGDDPTNTSEAYTTPFTLSETATVKAVSMLANGTSSPITSLEVAAGESIKLIANATLTDITEAGSSYAFSVTNTNLVGTPTVTFSYTYGDIKGEGATYTAAGAGKLSVIASAEGYESSDALETTVYEYEVGESLSLKDANVLAEDDAAWTYNSEGTRYANWSGYNGVSKAPYPYWTPAANGQGTIGNFTFEPSENVLMRTIGFIHNSGTQNLSIVGLPENATAKFVVSTYLSNPFNVFVDATEGTATYGIGAGNTGYAVEAVQLYTKKVPAFDPATAIVNADFTADEPIAQKVCTYAKDVQEGQVAQMQPLTGWTIVENGDARAAGTFAYGSTAILGGDGGNVPATGPNGETEGRVLGLEAVWSATTQYTQDVKLPAGEYLFEAVIYNAAGTGALSQNLIGIDGTYCTTKSYPVGKWTKDQVKITLAEEKTVTVSIGVNSGNVGNGSAPHLFIDHVKLYGSEEIAAIELAAAKENALAEVNALTIGEVLFTYPEAAITTAKSAIESATTVDEVNAAVTTAKAAQSKPAADKAYAIANTTATGNLCITTEKVSVAKDASVFFTEVEGGYVLSNEAGEYILKTAGNTWTLSTTTTKEEAYVVNFNLADGAYTIQGANGLFGLDSTDEGSIVYANKAQSNNGLWTIAEYVAPVKTDYTDHIVNADLTNTETKGWDDTGTKLIDGSGIVKASSAANFDFKQTISIPSGYYRLTAQAAYRYGADEAAEAEAIAASADTKLLTMYVTIGSNTYGIPVQNRYDGASDTDLAGEGAVQVNGKWVPNSSNAVKAWFNAGKYVNEVIFNMPNDGEVTIGISRRLTPESDYTVIGPWTLTRLGDAEVEPAPEPVDPIDYTSKIVNPSFEDGTTGWTYEPSNDHGAKENSNGTYTMTGCDGNYIFNIWSSGNAISQKVEGLPNGTYKLKAVIATDGGHKVQLNANGKSVQIDAVDKGTGVEGELEFNVLDGTATIGAEGVDKYWYKVDNFRLYFIKGFDIDELVTAYETALADAKTVEGNMNAEVKTALEAAIAAEVDKTNAEALGTTTATLVNATADAKASVAAYANAATILPKMKELTESTNVYTAEAYEQYYNQWVVKYEAATLTTAEANALQNPFLVTGWRASITCDNFLLSAWDTNPDFQDAPYYINSWSVEGENDGSNFKVPFFEYWTGDGDSLGERVLTATMNGLEAGDYNVTAWVRVRMKNGAEAPAFGITLQVNEGEAVDVAAGDQVGESQFYLKEFAAAGTVGEDGVLNIKFNIAGDNNISWLSFKNMKFTKLGVEEESEEVKVTYALKTDEKHASSDVVEVKNEEEAVVATLTFGEAGGEEFKAAKSDSHVEGFEAFTEGNGINGNKEGGTFYTIVPKFDGKVDVAVVLNADKAFYILEDGTALPDFDGITVSEKKYGTFTFDVKAEKAYKVYAAGTKLGFYGFNYTYKVAKQPEVNDDDPEITVPEGKINLIANGNLAGDDVSSFFAKESPSADIVGARIVPGFGENNSRGIVVKSANEASNADAWNTQFWIKVNQPLESGTKLHVEFDYAASQAAKASTQAHGAPGAYQHWAAIGDVNFTTEWQHFSTDITVDETMAKGDKGEGIGMISIAFNLAEEKTATEYYFDNFGVWAELPAPVDEWTDLIVNGDMEGESLECFYVTEQGFGGPYVAMATEGIGKDGSKAVKVQSADSPAQDWDSQFFIRLPYQLPAGTKFKLSFDYKADKAGDFDTQAHAEPGQYIHWACAGSGSFTTEWQIYEKEGTVPAECDGSENKNEAGEVLFLKTFQTIAFNLAKNKEATEFIFDNIKFEIPADVAKTLTPNPAVNPVYYKDVLLGIENVKVAQKADVIYNLRGQKVNKADKGLFIINGKKVVK